MKQRLWWTGIAGGLILALFFATLLALDGAGKRARVYGNIVHSLAGPAPVTIVRSSAELYSLYRSMGAHGRILVHLGKYLQFVEVPDDEVMGGREKFPLPLYDVMTAYRERVGYQNVLWVLMQDNIIREVYHVLPPPVFAEKARSVGTDDADISAVEEHAIIAHEWGARRVISDHLPRYDEPVLLSMDASFFDFPGAQRIIDELKKSGLTTDVVTMNLAEDNPDVSRASREQLRQAAELLSGRRP